MSEYWKSTPKYWCKHCKTFVRDTKLEKQNHEATPKHQGNLQRFLRELHRGNEREEREKQRAKDEVARLNGVSEGAVSSERYHTGKKSATPAPIDKRQATPADRKRQLQQLADMGVAVPEETRREMAMAGEWQIQSVTPVYKKVEIVEKEEDDEDQKSSTLAVGVRKRRLEEEEEEAGEAVVKKGWGSTTRTWQTGDNGDLDNLLKATKRIKPRPNPSSEASPPKESLVTSQKGEQSPNEHSESLVHQRIKREKSEDASAPTAEFERPFVSANVAVKSEDDVAEPVGIFKRRKSRPIQQKG